MKIALDAVGGDHGPAPCVEGALQAVKEFDVEVILVGDETTLKQECDVSPVTIPASPFGMLPRLSKCMSHLPRSLGRNETRRFGLRQS